MHKSFLIQIHDQKTIEWTMHMQAVYAGCPKKPETNWNHLLLEFEC